MPNIENMPRPEIILVADTVAREKNIDKEDVFVAMEVAIQKAARSRYGFEHDIRAQIDRKTGAITLERYREVVDEVENEVTQLTVEDAQAYKKGRCRRFHHRYPAADRLRPGCRPNRQTGDRAESARRRTQPPV